MNENFVASKIHQLILMSCFDLNELLQEGILFYFILFIVYISFIIEYDVNLFIYYYFFYPCYNIEQMSDIVIASEIYRSVSRNCVDLNELPIDGENNDICGEEIVV